MTDVCDMKIPYMGALFSSDIVSLLNFIQSQGFGLTLVGGAVRDYFLYQQIADDLDFEIRSSDGAKEEVWLRSINALASSLQKKFLLKIEFLEFGIFKFSYNGKNFEFSSPRIEIFDEDQKKWNHKDFRVTLISNLDYMTSFTRRDFTINAIGFELLDSQEIKLIDPFDGVGDIARQVLKPCGNDFFKDPVRFLRLLRFKSNTNFKISSEISSNLNRFNLEDLTHSYFLKEAFKTNPLKFFRLFFHYVQTAPITYNQNLAPLFFLAQDDAMVNEAALPVWDEKSLLVWMIFCKKFGDKHIWDFARYAKVNQSFVKNMLGLKESATALLQMDLEKLLRHLAPPNEAKIPEQSHLNIIGDFYTSYKRNSKQLIIYLACIPDAIWGQIFRLWEGIFHFYPHDLNIIKNIPPKSRKVFGIYLMLRNYHEYRQKLPK